MLSFPQSQMLADREMNENIQVNLEKADSLLRGDKAYI